MDCDPPLLFSVRLQTAVIADDLAQPPRAGTAGHVTWGDLR
jgi:hypothetical protein